MRAGTSVARPTASRPVERTDLTVDSWPVWSALCFDQGGLARRQRTAIRRDLHRIAALNLRPGLWAVAHRPDGPDTAGVEQLLARAGGDVRIVGPDETERDDRWDRSLGEVCRRLWDAFFNELDRCTEELTADGPNERSRCSWLDEVSEHFVGARRLDAIGHDTHRASLRLRQLMANPEAARSIAAAALLPLEPISNRTARIDRQIALRDGRVRANIVIDPTPTVPWGFAFEDFERRVYTPSSDRPAPLLSGLVMTGSRTEVEAACAALARRVQTFELGVL